MVRSRAAWNVILRVRLTELKIRRTAIDALLATAVVHVTLHPMPPVDIRRRVGKSEAALNDPDLIVEATRTIRSLVQQIVLTPDDASANVLAVHSHV